MNDSDRKEEDDASSHNGGTMCFLFQSNENQQLQFSPFSYDRYLTDIQVHLDVLNDSKGRQSDAVQCTVPIQTKRILFSSPMKYYQRYQSIDSSLTNIGDEILDSNSIIE